MLGRVRGLETMAYETTGPVARITLDRPARGNGITLAMPRELSLCVEEADADPSVHVICLSGRGTGFCGGYVLAGEAGGGRAHHHPPPPRGPGIDWARMSPNPRGVLPLFQPPKPQGCKAPGAPLAR